MQHDFDAVLGGKIHVLRKQENLSLDELAAEIGVSYQQMQKYEAGKNSISVWRFVQLSKLLKFDPRDLLDVDECMPEPWGERDGNSPTSSMWMIGERARLRKAYFSLSLEKRLAFLRLLEATATP